MIYLSSLHVKGFFSHYVSHDKIICQSLWLCPSNMALSRVLWTFGFCSSYIFEVRIDSTV